MGCTSGPGAINWGDAIGEKWFNGVPRPSAIDRSEPAEGGLVIATVPPPHASTLLVLQK